MTDEEPQETPRHDLLENLITALSLCDRVLVERKNALGEYDVVAFPVPTPTDLAREVLRLREENERLKKALIEEREENLWNAYNTGFEKDGRWHHAFMSDGEWLAREVGMDPKLGNYDAAAVKAAILKAAKRAALAQGEGE